MVEEGTATLLVENGVLTQEELNKYLGAEFKLGAPYASKGRPARTDREPFNVGDRVRVRPDRVKGHVRCPAYVLGKEGVVLHRTTVKWPFPDTIGHGDKTAVMQPTYHVQFKTTDIWGDSADEGFVVVDLFESYLDKVPAATSAAKKSADAVAA